MKQKNFNKLIQTTLGALFLASMSFAQVGPQKQISAVQFLLSQAVTAPGPCMFEPIGWDGSNFDQLSTYLIKLTDNQGNSDSVSIPKNAVFNVRVGTTHHVGSPDTTTVTYSADIDGKQILAIKTTTSPSFNYLQLGSVSCGNPSAQ